MGKESEQNFSKEDTQTANKQVKKKCLASLVIREMQMRITIRKHFIPTRITLIKNTVTSVEDMDNLEPSCLASGNVKLCSHF